jgi:hypothetical protein
MLVAAMTQDLMICRRIVNRMCRRRTIARGNALRASQMQRRFPGYSAAKTKTATTVIAALLGHRAHRVALGMIARSSAGTAGRSGCGNRYDAHAFILAVFSTVT